MNSWTPPGINSKLKAKTIANCFNWRLEMSSRWVVQQGSNAYEDPETHDEGAGGNGDYYGSANGNVYNRVPLTSLPSNDYAIPNASPTTVATSLNRTPTVVASPKSVELKKDRQICLIVSVILLGLLQLGMVAVFVVDKMGILKQLTGSTYYSLQIKLCWCYKFSE